MGNVHPWKDQKPCVAGDEMEAFAPIFLRPSDEPVPAPDVPRGGAPRQASDRPTIGKEHIFEMFPYRMNIAQVMVLRHQGVEQGFKRGTPDLLAFQGQDVSQSPGDGALIHGYRRGLFPMGQRIVGRTCWGGQMDVACPMELKEKSPAYHFPENPILLHPVPCSAKPPRQTATGVVGIFFYEPLNKGHILRRGNLASVSDSQVHGINIRHKDAERKWPSSKFFIIIGFFSIPDPSAPLWDLRSRSRPAVHGQQAGSTGHPSFLATTEVFLNSSAFGTTKTPAHRTSRS